MRHSSENWLELFDIECTSPEDWMPPRVMKSESTVLGYRVKTIRAGEQIEVMVYPIWSTTPTLPDGTPIKKSAAAIARANAGNARKHFERKMNTNFCDLDYGIDLTYADDFLPDAGQARLDVQNYLRRVKYACRKAGLSQPRYMGVSEGKREGSRQKRVHHHKALEHFSERSRAALPSKAKKRKRGVRHQRQCTQQNRFGERPIANHAILKGF